MLSAAVAVSASAGITRTSVNKKIGEYNASTKKVERLTRASGKNAIGKAINEFQFKGWDQRDAKYRAGSSYSWDFEDTTQLQGWAIVDNDSDGYCWTYADTTLKAHSGNCCLFSNSYVNNEDGNGGTALTPDNWLISPEVTFANYLELWAVGQDPSYAAEVFAVYVTVDGENYIKVGGDFTTSGDYARFVVDLTEYAGQVGHFCIRHYNVTDQFILCIDDIAMSDDIVFVPAAQLPTNLAVTAGETYGNVTWDGTEGNQWNLHYRPYVDISGNYINCTLPLETYEAELDDWFIYDADGDGENWTLNYSSSAQDDLCWFSYSYYSGTSYTPDNWLLTRDILLRGELKFTLWGQNNSYPDNMQVYAYVYDDEAENGFVAHQLFEEDLKTTTTHETYTVDLNQFGGKLGFIVFRHYNCSDMFYLYLDDIFIGDANIPLVEQPEWIEVNGLTETNYSITGLTPNTEYEVQVQEYNSEGATSNWTLSENFWTLAEANNVYIIGEVNDKTWAPNDGVQMTFEDGVYTATVNFDGRNNENGEEVNYFALTKKLAATADDWATCNANRFGSETDGDFWVTPELMGQELGLIFPYEMSYRIPAGDYKLTVNMDAMTLVIEDLNPAPQGLRGDVDMNEEVAIADVSALIDYLLTGDATGISLQNADCDLSGTDAPDVTIADVSALIDYLLNGAW